MAIDGEIVAAPRMVGVFPTTTSADRCSVGTPSFTASAHARRAPRRSPEVSKVASVDRVATSSTYQR
jgi:hypothetical protein